MLPRLEICCLSTDPFITAGFIGPLRPVSNLPNFSTVAPTFFAIEVPEETAEMILGGPLAHRGLKIFFTFETNTEAAAQIKQLFLVIQGQT